MKVEINLGAIKSNLKEIKKRIKSDICGVLKADAYGHGALKVADVIKDDVKMFAVATADEATALVKSGIKKDILIMSPLLKTCSFPKNVILTVSDIESAKALQNTKNSVAVKINSGMNRLGESAQKTKETVKLLDSNKTPIKYAFTHFYNGQSIEESNLQLDSFTDTLMQSGLYHRGIKTSCAASSAIALPEKFGLDFVRIGIAMYGIGENLIPAMKIYSYIVGIRYVKRGEHIGYGDYIAKKSMTVATVRCGYGDGYRRKINFEKRFVSVSGQRREVLGQICMDLFMVDITGLDITVGDKVYILGDAVDVYDLSFQLSTIPYEVFTMINKRAERVYIE